jgi:hypothetical protein
MIDEYDSPRLIRFHIRINNLYEFAQPLLERNQKMRRLTTEERTRFDQQQTCYLCKEELGADRDLDHCHYTGEPLGESFFIMTS